MKRLLSIMVGISMIGASGALASEPIQLSLTPDIALHGETVPIRGLSLNIWGENPQEGLAIGFVNGSSGFWRNLLGRRPEDAHGSGIPERAVPYYARSIVFH